MSSASSLVVPLTMWGRHAPTHCISALYLLRDQRTMITGAADGQVILWEVDPNSGDESSSAAAWSFLPRHLLVGHTAPVKCIAKASSGSDCHHIVTSSESGEMFTWDTVDGRALESRRYPHRIHTSMQAYRTPDSAKVKLFCCGFYEEICVMEPFTLDVLFTLSSRTCPDWVSAFHVLRPRNRKDDVVLALTASGVVKVWTLNGDEEENNNGGANGGLDSSPILENESKQIKCTGAVSMTCCVYNMRTVLVVCAGFWNIYDAGDFTCLLTVNARRGERWVGGEFVAGDRVAVWSDDGSAYLYQLPPNCIVDNKEFHNKNRTAASGATLIMAELRLGAIDGGGAGDPGHVAPLKCPPAFKYLIFNKDNRWMKYLVRGDDDGRIAVWRIPEPAEVTAAVERRPGSNVALFRPQVAVTLRDIWRASVPTPEGILGQLNDPEEPGEEGAVPLTATIFLPLQCRLVCGREDGSIILVPATQTIMLHLLSGKHQKFSNWPQHQVLLGHEARVNCLLYPHNESPRYDVAHLVSGSSDFNVCLWDIYTGALLHKFAPHAGEISNLYVPPADTSPRVQHCICSVASDNSVTLLSLKERRCVMLASRHLFPVTTIKWRPADDFLIVACSDGSAFVWQMETGHLDRVVHGSAAEEILAACDEASTITLSENVGANPALHFFRGLRHRNLAAIKLATQTGINQLQGNKAQLEIREKSRAFPLVINGFRTNQADSENHILFFDVEGLIVQLLTEEYAAMSPGTMEAQGFTHQREYEKVWALTRPGSPDTAKKIVGLLNKVKDKADDRLSSHLQTASPETQKRFTGIMAKVKDGAEKAKGQLDKAKQEIERRAGALDEEANAGGRDSDVVRPAALHLEINLTLEIGQLLLSLLHAWGLDKDLDKVATSKLGLLRPKVPVSFGILSKGGVMSLTLPTWYPRPAKKMSLQETAVTTTATTIPDLDTYYFTALGHWELSHTVTTNHLLSVISITNTLVSVSNASFIPEQERKRKLVRQATHGAMELPEGTDTSFNSVQEQIKKGWSLLSTLHCLLLSSKLKGLGSAAFKKPQVELLAQRWQDRCLQIRMSAQELLIAELKNLGSKGRKHLVDTWGQFLPKYADPPFQMTNGQQAAALQAAAAAGGVGQSSGGSQANGDAKGGDGGGEGGVVDLDDESLEDDDDEEAASSAVVQAKRNQTTAVILLGVIGALFDLEAEKEGKEMALGNNLTRLTAKALMYLVLSSQHPPPSSSAAAQAQQQQNGGGSTPAQQNGGAQQPSSEGGGGAAGAPGGARVNPTLRRAAIDLIGRGFTLWEPHLEVSKVILGLLDMCSKADWWVPSSKYGLPLTHVGDSCRTARHSLAHIAKVRPAVFITSAAKEIARYNNLASNAQALQINMAAHVLARSKAEILHLVELLITASRKELGDLLVDVVDIVLHCIDANHLRSKSLSEVFSPICLFPQVSHCMATRRLAVGTKAGQLAMYDLRSNKVQMISAHSGPLVATAFGPDGKNLATYASADNRLCFWQTSTGMFGLGNAQTKCTKSVNTPPLAQAVAWNPMYAPKLVWINGKTVTLMLPDGTEHRFNC